VDLQTITKERTCFMTGAMQIANDGKCASQTKRIEGFVVLSASNTIQALTADNSISFQKLWIYPGPSATGGIVNANAANIYVGNTARQLVSKSVTRLIGKADSTERVSLLVTATAASHGFATYDNVTIAGANDNAYNGTFQITVVDANTFTYTVADIPLNGNPGGTITAAGLQTVASANNVTPDVLQPTDLPLKYELPLGQKQLLSSVLIQGAQNDGVFYRLWA